MKYLIIIFVLTFGISSAQKIAFYEKPFDEMLQISGSQKKPILYMCYASWCSHCIKMKAEVITDPAVADFYNTNFVNAWQDMEKGEGVALRKRFHVKSYPTFIVLDSDGEILYAFNGELKADEFIKEGKNALDPAKQFPILRDKTNADPSNPDKVLEYISALRRANFETEAVAQKYLSTVAEKDLISGTNWKIIANGIRNIKAPEFQFVLKNQTAFAAVSSQKRVERKILNVVEETLKPAVDATDTLSYFQKRPYVAAIAIYKTDSLLFKHDRIILEQAKNWKAYRETVEKGIDFVWKSPQELKDIATIYLQSINDKKALQLAATWARRANEMVENKGALLIEAKLELKYGDKIAAKSTAEKLLGLCRKYHWDTADADQLMKEINAY